MIKVRSMQKVKVKCQRSRSQRSKPYFAISEPSFQFEFTYHDEMMHRAWCCLGEVPYFLSRSSVKFQGHTAKKIVNLDPNWSFPDCDSSLNSPMATKWCKKLEVAWKRCPIVFRGHPPISRSHGLKNWQFESNLSKITRPVAAIKSLRFALFHMVASSNGNIFNVSGPMWGHWWIPLTKASGAELWCLLWHAPEQTVEQKIKMPVIWDAMAPIITSM